MTPDEQAKVRATDGLVVRGRPPFAMTPTTLLRNPTISSHAVRLWSVLASYTYGDQATDRPSRSQLATDVGWKSLRSVDTYLAELQGAGYLTIERQWRVDGGKARNLYILEWAPREGSHRIDGEVPLPVDNPVSAGQTQAQDSAHGGTRPANAIVDNSVSAGQTQAQDSAHGVEQPGTQVQDPAPTQVQDSAHLGIRTKTKKEPPPTDRLAAVGGDHSPRLGRPEDLPTANRLLGTIRSSLPDRLRRQLTSSALRPRAAQLAAVGWTEPALRQAVCARSWDGAGPGAAMVWLADLVFEPPPAPPVDAADARAQLAHQRAERAQALAAAASPGSESRRQALELVARLGRRSKDVSSRRRSIGSDSHLDRGQTGAAGAR